MTPPDNAELIHWDARAARCWIDGPWMRFAVVESVEYDNGTRSYGGLAGETDDIAKADVEVAGYVASDGCSRWWWPAEQHVCGRADIAAHAAMHTAIFDQAARMLPNWSEDDA